MIDTKYPEITVKLVGKDGNVFNLISCCLQVMRIAGLDKQRARQFRKRGDECNKAIPKLFIL